MKRIGRNDPCPCGSGQKYKNCCEGNEPWHKRTTTLVLLVVLLLGLVAVAWTSFSNPNRVSPDNPPAGKVWSEEHGHYH
jgi:hypothetical protein